MYYVLEQQPVKVDLTLFFENFGNNIPWGATQEHLQARNHSSTFDMIFYRLMCQNSRKPELPPWFGFREF